MIPSLFRRAAVPFLIFISLINFACSDEPDLDLKGDAYSFNGRLLNEDQIGLMKGLFENLNSCDKNLSGQPEIIIRAYGIDGSSAEYNVYMKHNAVYRGDYRNAMRKYHRGEPSQCYRLDALTRHFLKEILTAINHQP